MAKALANKKPRYTPTSHVFNIISREKEKSFTQLDQVETRDCNEKLTGIKESASPHCTRVEIAIVIVILCAIGLIVGLAVAFTRNKSDDGREKQTTVYPATLPQGTSPSTTSKTTDCLQNCNIGSNDARCNVCFCGLNDIIGRVYSVSTGYPLGNATVHSKSESTVQLALSNLTGHFSFESKCTPPHLFVSKQGYVDTAIHVNTTYLEIHMPKIVKPYLIETPKSKNRLVAENVTFCCIASANPDVHYYEWLRNHSVLDNHVYLNQTQLLLTNLRQSDSGIYQCKAYSDTGVIMSEIAELNVKATPNDFCNDALKLKPAQLPDDCVQQNTNSTTYKLHECSGSRCRNHTSSGNQNCRDADNFCCAIKDFQIVTLNCSDYVIELVDAQSCVCDSCTVSEIIVLGTAKGLQDGSPVKFGTVYVNGEIKGYTTAQGFFEISIEPLLSKIIIMIQDNFINEFLPAVKIIELSDDVLDTLKVEVKMMRAAKPIKIDSSVENILQAGFSSESNASNVLLSIPENAFYFENGSQFFGIVEARLTFLDPSNTSVFDDIPGEFEYIDEEGNTGGLISLGVFNLYFEDIYGNPLIMNKVIDAYMPEDDDGSGRDFKLWNLSPRTGIWELEKDNGEITRKKRSGANTWVGALADVSKQTWYNYDKVYKLANSNPECYFNFDLYKSIEMAESVTNLPILRFNIHIIRGKTAHSIGHFTSKKGCLNIPCENENAYITVYPFYDTTKQIYTGGPYPSHSSTYSISSDERVLTVNLSSSRNGPFYKTKSLCEASNSNIAPHLRFFYGISNYEWKFNEKSPNCNPNYSAIRIRSWYQTNALTGYRVCFVKVKVDINVSGMLSSNKMKIRVLSFGGTCRDIKDKIIGIHETNVDTSKTYCIEYRCSGSIDHCDLGKVDNTKVKIILEYPSQYGICRVNEIRIKKSDHNYDIDNQILNDGKFTFYAENVDGGPADGIYSINRMKMGNARSAAEDYCRKSVLPPAPFGTPNSDNGYAVAFHCT